MSSTKVLRYRNNEVPRQSGEVGRLRVIKGPDQGVIYLVKASSVTLGRGEEVDILINDLKASRSHARLDFTTEGWVMSDLGSANGIFFHGQYVRNFPVVSGEHFTIGESIFEFFDANESTRVLTAPLRPAAEVDHMDQALAAQRMKIQGFSKAAHEAQPANAGKKKPPIVLIVAGLAGIYFCFDDIKAFIDPPTNQKPPAQQVKKEEGEHEALSSYLPVGVSRDVEKTAEQYYRQGFREFREGNYLRAKAQFELALQVNPSHQQARHYLLGSEKEIENEIKLMIGAAQKATVAGRLREAKGYYETAMRLMYYDRSNPDFIECEEAANKIKNELSRMPAGSGE